MAILSDADRRDLWAQYMRDISDLREPCAINKTDLRAALDAMDQWVSDNQASFNAAIPLPARTALTSSQKARGLMLVISKRFVKGV